MKARVMFYCQHVLGMGHLIRSAEIVRGLAEAGAEVCFLNGGEIVDGFVMPEAVRVVNLPPIKSDAEFREIQTAVATLSLEQIRDKRKRILCAEYQQQQPDVLVIELFPFGRRKFAFELLPLLEAIQANGHRTRVVCSLRDILVSKRDQARYEQQTIDWMNQYFDLLLVHSDPQFQRLEETFSRLDEITCPVQYTGFVTQPSRQTTRAEHSTIAEKKYATIVASIGGGRVGAELLHCTLEASELLAEQLPHQLRIFTGPYCPDEEFALLHARAATLSHVTLERYNPEFVAELESADLSISMAGYNTCMNILTTGVRAIVCPFTGNNNEEQTIRAEKLQRLDLVSVIRSDELRPERLAWLMREELKKTVTRQPQLDLHGTAQTVQLIEACLSDSVRGKEKLLSERRAFLFV